MKIRYVFWFIVPLLSVGCAAPFQITAAQGIKEMAFRQYLTNNRTAWNAVTKVLKSSRDQAVVAADNLYLETAISATVAENKAPTLKPEQVREMYRVGRDKLAKANGQTADLLARLDIMRNKADVSFAQGQALDKEIANFMAAGVDEAFFAEMAKYIIDTAGPLVEKGVK